MRVEWENYKDYGDGDITNWCEGKFYLNDGREYEVTIYDHTRPDQQQEDEHYRRQVTHAYEISGMPYYRSAKAFYKVGFDSHPGLNSVGLDVNPGYEDGTSMHSYKGSVPEHSIEEVEALVEKAFVESFQFDYEAELAKYKAELDKRQAAMDEVNAWRKGIAPYKVFASSNPLGETVCENTFTNPEEAIIEWCKLNERYRTCVSIHPANASDAHALLRWAIDNSDKLEAYMKQYNSPYKYEWIIEQVRTQVIKNKVSMQWEYDQLHPFCMG